MIDSIAIDPPDDLSKGNPFTRQNLARIVAEYKRWGLHRIYWQYYGEPDGGLWDEAGPGCNFTNSSAAAKSFENLGSPLRCLCEIAHAEGLRVYAILKPFDHGHSLTGLLPEDSPLAKRYGRLKRVGGYTRILAKYLRESPGLLMRRFPTMPPGQDADLPITEIRLYKEDHTPSAVNPDRLSLWTSRHNGSYSPYRGPMQIEEAIVERDEPVYHLNWNTPGPTRRKVRLIRIFGVEIHQPYMAVALAPGGEGNTFSNRLYALAELINSAGETAVFTYGLTSLDEERLRPGADFRRAGVSFDLPTSELQTRVLEQDPIRAVYSLDNDKGFLAFGRGKNRSLYGAGCPSCPEVRSEWLRWIGNCLSAGVDGVSIRTTKNHNRTLEWEAYGFNPPAVAAFTKRCGADVTKEPFDGTAWRRLRGEFYTEFLKGASSLVRAAGKTFQIMIEPPMLVSESQVHLMGLHYDWETWIRSGIADEICLFKIDLSHPRFAEVIHKTQERNLPVDWSCHVPESSPDDLAHSIASITRQAAHAGVERVMLYENASILKLGARGGVRCAAPELVKAIVRLR